MIAFGFIENFFFISLALVFVLVLLLVYHFKNRITVAEKKSDSMYGLLTAVVKEIKTLRGMFGLGSGQDIDNSRIQNDSKNSVEMADSSAGSVPLGIGQSTNQTALKSKTEPEVDIGASSNNNFAAFVQKTGGVQREVITLEFAASDSKIVVSDVEESDDESSSSEESDDESSVSDAEENYPKEELFEIQEQIDCDDIQDVVDVDVDVETKQEFTNEQVQEIDISNILSATNSDEIEVDLVETKPVMETMFASPTVPSIEQLRKMNINQLKTIASQIGISSDISKMKKPELISLIRGSIDDK